MTTVVDVCNRALSLIGTRSTITALNQAVPEARQCLLHYDSVRQGLLRRHPWDFAKVSILGTQLKASLQNGQPWVSALEPPPPWLYEYAYPNDALKIRWIQTQQSQGTVGVPLYGNVQYAQSPISRVYEFSRGLDIITSVPVPVLYCNVQYAIIVYTIDVVDPDAWDAAFDGLISLALAAELATPLTGKFAMRKELLIELDAELRAAQVQDGNDGLEIMYNFEQDPPSIRAREEY